jgi:asparagine synthase (glutamine-hydrolysing)
MCGIVGILSHLDKSFHTSALLNSMSETLAHRGPNGSGVYLDDNIAMAHRRLSIIDLSSNAKQPFSSYDNSLVLIFNGEIYNYSEIKNLVHNDYPFKSASDGEVILPLYQKFGSNFIKHLEGMFAFALYDKKKKLLFLARDRIGEKPLYYTWYKNCLFFSSELKSFWEIPDFRPRLSKIAILNYLAYTQSPAPYSMYESVYKVIPGHYLIVDRGNKIIQKNYWNIDYTNKLKYTEHEATEKLDKLLHHTMKKTLVSDVPVGIALSGGIDSSVLLGHMSGIYSEVINSFTLGSNHQFNSIDPELGRAEIVAKLFQTHEHFCDFKDISFADFLKAESYYDEPVGILDTVHSMFLSKYMSRYHKVIITGNGADEVFGGYKSYSNFLRKNFLKQCFIRASRPPIKTIQSFLTKNVLKTMSANSLQLLTNDMILFSSNPDFIEYLDIYYKMSNYDNFLDGKLFFELLITLNHSASMSDTLGMVNSLEIRAPFLNHHIIEFAASLPVHYKVKLLSHSNRNKYILKRLALKYMPKELIFVKKYGCGSFINYHDKFRTIWKADIEQMLFYSNTEIYEFFSKEKIKCLWIKFLSSGLSSNESMLLNKVIIFFAWYISVYVNRKSFFQLKH